MKTKLLATEYVSLLQVVSLVRYVDLSTLPVSCLTTLGQSSLKGPLQISSVC